MLSFRPRRSRHPLHQIVTNSPIFPFSWVSLGWRSKGTPFLVGAVALSPWQKKEKTVNYCIYTITLQRKKKDFYRTNVPCTDCACGKFTKCHVFLHEITLGCVKIAMTLRFMNRAVTIHATAKRIYRKIKQSVFQKEKATSQLKKICLIRGAKRKSLLFLNYDVYFWCTRKGFLCSFVFMTIFPHMKGHHTLRITANLICQEEYFVFITYFMSSAFNVRTYLWKYIFSFNVGTYKRR